MKKKKSGARVFRICEFIYEKEKGNPRGLASVYTVTFANIIDLPEISTRIPNQPPHLQNVLNRSFERRAISQLAKFAGVDSSSI